MTNLDRCYNIFDLREVAKRRLPKGVFEFIDRGTEDEIALAENREAFKRIKLRTRFLTDLSKRDLGTEIFGKRTNLPFAIAPTGSAGLMWYQGELELAKAAATAGIVKALARGANLVLIGRATLYGTACGGRAGAAKAIDILAGEMERTFGYISVRRVSEIGPHIFAPRNLGV